MNALRTDRPSLLARLTAGSCRPRRPHAFRFVPAHDSGQIVDPVAACNLPMAADHSISAGLPAEHPHFRSPAPTQHGWLVRALTPSLMTIVGNEHDC